jgi:hypothetical protein
MNSEQYENLIEFLKQALSFYANKENYLFYKDKDAPIALDEGSQARFALKRVQEILDENQKMKDDYNRLINDTINAIENHPFDISNLKAEINALNKIGNDGHD